MSNTFKVRETVHSWQPEQTESFGSCKKICCRCLCILPDAHVLTETIRPYNLLTNTGSSSQQPLHFITAFLLVSKRICADALRECAFSSRVKGPYVFWPASGPVNTFQWLTADRWSAEAAGGPWWDGRWESALYVDITATYVLKKQKRNDSYSGQSMPWCIMDFIKLQWKAATKRTNWQRERVKMTQVPHASSASCLGVISIAGARLERWGCNKRGTHQSTDGAAANTARNVSLRPFPLWVGHRMMNHAFL